MGDPNQAWLSEYEGCTQRGHEIMEQIHERNGAQKGTSTYTKLSASLRSGMKQFSADLSHLRQELMKTSRGYHMTQREEDRRLQMLEQLAAKERQIEAAFKNENTAAELRNSRAGLLDEGLSSGRGGSEWGMQDVTDMADMGFDQVRTQQQQIMNEQDHGLEALSHVLGRQKQMALDIGNEVDSQNDLIDDIHDHVDRTDQRLLRETRHIGVVSKKSNTCGLLVTAALLFVAIIVVLVVPYNGKF